MNFISSRWHTHHMWLRLFSWALISQHFWAVRLLSFFSHFSAREPVSIYIWYQWFVFMLCTLVLPNMPCDNLVGQIPAFQIDSSARFESRWKPITVVGYYDILINYSTTTRWPLQISHQLVPICQTNIRLICVTHFTNQMYDTGRRNRSTISSIWQTCRNHL